MIDPVVTSSPYPCSVCKQVRNASPDDPEPVLRLLNLKPDFPQESPPVDILVCPDCLQEFERRTREVIREGLAATIGFFRSRVPEATR